MAPGGGPFNATSEELREEGSGSQEEEEEEEEEEDEFSFLEIIVNMMASSYLHAAPLSTEEMTAVVADFEANMAAVTQEINTCLWAVSSATDYEQAMTAVNNMLGNVGPHIDNTNGDASILVGRSYIYGVEFYVNCEIGEAGSRSCIYEHLTSLIDMISQIDFEDVEQSCTALVSSDSEDVEELGQLFAEDMHCLLTNRVAPLEDIVSSYSELANLFVMAEEQIQSGGSMMETELFQVLTQEGDQVMEQVASFFKLLVNLRLEVQAIADLVRQ